MPYIIPCIQLGLRLVRKYKKALDEATARATAIHDGAERRLNLLSTRHSETIKRLTDILDGVSSLVAAETARMSLEDEVDQTTAKTIAASESNGAPRPAESASAAASPGSGRPTGPSGPRPTAAPPAPSASARTPGPAGPAQPGLNPSTPSNPSSPSNPSTPTQPSQPSSPSAQSQSAQSQSAQSQEKQHSPVRSAVIDAEETAEGIRIMPGGDNLDRPPSWR